MSLKKFDETKKGTFPYWFNHWKAYNLYALELPFHDVERDGIACGHPTEATHRKDADRIYDFMRGEGLI